MEEKTLPMITFTSPSSVITKKENFSNLFRVCPSDTYQAMALVELIKNFFWEKIGILTVKGKYEEALAAEIKDILKSKNVQVTALIIFEPNADTKTEKMKEVKQSGAAVNLIIANPKDVLQIYQEAFEMVCCFWFHYIFQDNTQQTKDVCRTSQSSLKFCNQIQHPKDVLETSMPAGNSLVVIFLLYATKYNFLMSHLKKKVSKLKS